MSEQKWSEPIEPGKPLSIDILDCVVIGVYLGHTSFVQEKGDGAGRESRIHEVELSEGHRVPGGAQPGDSFRFWGSYDLDLKLRRIRDGELVRVEYKGTDSLSGDREMKRFDVRRGASKASKGSSSSSVPTPF